MTESNKDAVMRNLIAVAILAPLVALAGCSDSTNFLGKKSKGIVYDGYLAGAKVCVDQIVNRQCDDPPEPATFTDADGGFRLTALTPEQARYPLVAEVVPGTTIDLDTGLPAPAGLKYLAPAGSNSISAFSTIVQIRIEQEIVAGLNVVPIVVPDLVTLKKTVTEALTTELGLPANIDLTDYDPIKVKNKGSASAAARETAAKLHIVNQILTAQIVEFLPLAVANANPPSQESAAYPALIAKLDPAQVLAEVEAYIAANTLTLADLLDPAFDPAIIPVTDPAVPTQAEIFIQFENDVNIAQSIDNLVNGGQAVTGGTGGTP
ncbi:hypothetical protein [Alcanivorax sp. 1008]|uniref:hypothetical protein n=1 Tax=Alcanivorax sp. 1008 TaxID=2816853 RepID=UPI001E5F2D76|nr:hypothetical protein [Alcanivorax sp. 1008]